MATGGDFTGMLEGGHESFYDFSCSLCEKEGKHMESTRYCEKCLVYMCDSCARYHDRFPLNLSHKLLDQSQFTSVNQPVLKTFQTRRCQKHLGELINIFCEDHNVVCCSVCEALDHSSCVKTKHLPDAAKKMQLSQEYQTTKEEMVKLLTKVNKVITNCRADFSRIKKEKDHVRQTIANFRKKMNEYFDTLERKSLTELDLREKSITAKINKDTKCLEIMKIKVDGFVKQLKNVNEDNDRELFVQVKTGKRFVQDSIRKVQDISKLVQTESIRFYIKPEIDTFLSELECLGTFSKPRPVPDQAANLVHSQFSSANSADRIYDINQAQICGKYVKEKSDKGVCNCNYPKLKRHDPPLELLDSAKLLDLMK